MKIHHICISTNNIFPILEQSNYNVVGGAEIRIKKYGEYLVGQGTNVEIITYIPNQNQKITGKSGIEYYNLYNLHKPAFFHLVKNLAKIFRNMKSKVIYKRAYDPYLFLFALFARIFRKKLVFGMASDADCNLHTNIQRYGYFIGIFYNWGISLSAKIILQSKKQMKIIAPSLRKKSIIILKGIDADFTHDINTFNNRSYFLWVGRFSKVKRPELIKKIAVSGLHIKIIGKIDENYLPLLKELKKNLNVEYLGVLTPPELMKRYQEAFALINTSDYEGFPETFIEAWSAGTPVISLKFKMSDLMAGQGGVYAEGSIDKMINAMKKLIDDRDFFDKMSESAQKLIREKYRFSNEMKSFIKAILEVEVKG